MCPSLCWLIEVAAQTVLVWRNCGDDGLMAVHHIRGRRRPPLKARFAKRVLHKTHKTVRLGQNSSQMESRSLARDRRDPRRASDGA